MNKTLKGRTILVAEDNSINKMIVKHALTLLGASVVFAETGEEVLAAIKNQAFDAVLMDIQMPVMDGYEATHIIRNEMKLDVPIVAMTAFAFMGESKRCFEAGMNGYITKPFTLEILSAEVEKVLPEKQLILN